MKNKHIFALIFVMLVMVIFSGCGHKEKIIIKEVPGPPDTLLPLTLSLLQRMGESYGSNDITRYQMLLVGQIVLEKENPDITIHKPIYGEEGKAEIRTVHKRDVITIKDQEKGQALRMENKGSRVFISVCFEDWEGEYKDDYLSFSCKAEERDSFFYLNFTPSTASALSEEKGTLVYGGNSFRLKFTGNTPYLLIKLSQKDTEDPKIRTAPGRVIK